MAIAFDAKSTQSSTTTSQSTSHTCTGSNLVLTTWILFYNAGSASDLITSVNWNTSETMTQILKSTADSNITLYCYTLANPTTGTHNVTITASSSVTIYTVNSSYTGAKQTGIPDASTTKGSTASPNTTSVTTITDNCWTLLWARGSAPTASTGSVLRQAVGSGDTVLFDSNTALTPAGSKSMVITDGANSYTQMISLAPANLDVTVTMSTGTYALTGNATIITKAVVVIMATGSYILSGIDTLIRIAGTIWTAQSKNSSTWTAQSKNSSTWTAQSKNSSTWTSQSKN